MAFGVTPLREAILAGKEGVVRSLLQAGADPGRKHTCVQGCGSRKEIFKEKPETCLAMENNFNVNKTLKKKQIQLKMVAETHLLAGLIIANSK